jgi:hypothetical protein
MFNHGGNHMTKCSKSILRLLSPIPALFAGSLLVSFTAGAADYPATFESLDKDGNGSISSDEAAARPDLVENWAEIDVNSDNTVTITEFSAFEGKAKLSPPEESEEPSPGAAPY